MGIRHARTALVAAALFCCGAAVEAAATSPEVYGYIERAMIGEAGLEMDAKLDTGAESSSVNATDIDIYEQEGDPGDHWVRFALRDDAGKRVELDLDVISFVLIQQQDGGAERRPVVKMPICIGSVLAATEVNLADRSKLDYQLLVGRHFLAGRILVAAGETYSSETTCDMADEP